MKYKRLEATSTDNGYIVLRSIECDGFEKPENICTLRFPQI